MDHLLYNYLTGIFRFCKIPNVTKWGGSRMAQEKNKKAQKQDRIVNPIRVLLVDLKRTGIWLGIAVAITLAGAWVVESLL